MGVLLYILGPILCEKTQKKKKSYHDDGEENTKEARVGERNVPSRIRLRSLYLTLTYAPMQTRSTGAREGENAPQSSLLRPILLSPFLSFFLSFFLPSFLSFSFSRGRVLGAQQTDAAS